MSSSSARISERQRSFKKGIDADMTRRRRESTTVQIRKTVKEDRLNQRRRIMDTMEELNAAEASVDMAGTPPGTPPNGVSIQDLPKIAAMIQSLDPMEQTTAVAKLRRLLSLGTLATRFLLLQWSLCDAALTDVLMHIVCTCNRKQSADPGSDQPRRRAAARKLSAHARQAGAPVRVCVGADQYRVGHVQPHRGGDLVRRRARALRAAAFLERRRVRTGGVGARQHLGRFAAVPRLGAELGRDDAATGGAAKELGGKPKPDFNLVSPALMLLPHLIFSPDEEVATDACWTLSYLSDGRSECIQAVIDAGVCSKVVDLIGHNLTSIQTPALRTVGNIVTGDEHQTQAILDLGILPRLVPLLKHQKKLIRKEACWAISNITAGTQSQIQEVIDANIIAPLLFQLSTVEFEVKKEAAWAISNATSGGSPDQIKYLVHQGCIPPLVKLLDSQDTQVINVCLDALENILRLGEAERTIDGDNKMAIYIEEAEGLELIQNLQYHQEEELYEKAVRIIRDYFDGDDDEEFEYLAPEIDFDSRQFAFGSENHSAAGNQFNF